MIEVDEIKPEEDTIDKNDSDFEDLPEVVLQRFNSKMPVDEVEDSDSEDFNLDGNQMILEEEKMGNKEILKFKKKTMEDIEEKLKNYNFRCDVYTEDEETGDSIYPMFTTLVDFYQSEHFKLKSSGFLLSSRFLMTEKSKSTFKNISFKNYLDTTTNRKLKKINDTLLESTTASQLGQLSTSSTNIENFFSRIITPTEFEEEFMPFLNNLTMFLKKFDMRNSNKYTSSFMPTKRYEYITDKKKEVEEEKYGIA